MKKLVVRAQEGDADAFVQLVEQYRQQMYKIAFCYLASGEDVADAIQDTILDAYEHIGSLKKVQRLPQPAGAGNHAGNGAGPGSQGSGSGADHMPGDASGT